MDFNILLKIYKIAPLQSNDVTWRNKDTSPDFLSLDVSTVQPRFIICCRY